MDKKTSGRLKLVTKYDIPKLVPLLMLYLFITTVFSAHMLRGDETGYLLYATRLLQGCYSTREHVHLWWGPGYPIILAPFVFLNLPLLTARLANPFFLFGASIYFYKTVKLYTSQKRAIVLAYCLGLYPPLMRQMCTLMTESLILFLVCGFMFHFCKLHKEPPKAWPHLLAASMCLGYLALTKIFFGYVIMTGLVFYLLLFAWKRKEYLRKTTCVYILALLMCTPYLLLTYSQTGKIFYWGTSGGASLYWLSTPYKNELGSWFSPEKVKKLPELAPHRDFFDKIAGFSETAQDEAFKKRAINNILHHPKKCFVNWVANIGRLLFSYPFSFTPQRMSTYFYLLPNAFIIVLFILRAYPAILRWENIPCELSSLIFFAIVVFSGSSLLAAYERQFRPLVPILLLWLCFVYTHILKIEVRPESKITPEKK